MLLMIRGFKLAAIVLHFFDNSSHRDAATRSAGSRAAVPFLRRPGRAQRADPAKNWDARKEPAPAYLDLWPFFVRFRMNTTAVMESFKHSCPFCGQHVEYTAGYCGRQMKCPICGNTITFPAIPPKTNAQGARAERPRQGAGRKWAWNPRSIFLFLRDFPHWKTAAQIVVPFLIVGGLLAGAGYVKKTFTDPPPDAPAETPVQTDPEAWRKMTDLTRADQAVQEQLKITLALRAVLKERETIRAATRRQYPGNSNPSAVSSADAAADKARNNYMTANQRFESLDREYQRLGGTVDYRRRLSNN
jgi:hypothetical protein